MTITLRPETAEDAAFLFMLYASTREAEMAMVPLPEEQKRALLEMQFRAQAAHYRGQFAEASFSVVLCGQETAGRMIVLRGEEDTRIVDIALLPAWRGKGIGASLLSQLLREAELEGKTVSLHVDPLSMARRLYERMGFTMEEDKIFSLFMVWRPANLRRTPSV